MNSPSHLRALPLSSMVIAAIMLGACASGPPAPVENRTRAPVMRSTPLVSGGAVASPGTAPVVSVTPAPRAQAPSPASSAPDFPGPADGGGAQTAPVRSSGVEVRPLGATGPAPAASGAPGASAVPGATGSAAIPPPPAPAVVVKREPRGTKRPYSDAALAEVRSAESAARADAAAAARVEGSAPAASAGTAPGGPAATGTGTASRPPVAGAGTGAGTGAGAASPPSASGAAAAAPGPAPGAGAGSSASSGEFAWPVKGKVIQTFAESRSTGISIAAAAGDPVSAVADGKVIFSGLGPRGYGNLIIVKHEGDTLSVYGHGRTLLVKEGQTVRRGQKIAEAGDSGTDKPKLLFEIRKAGKPVDPLKLLPAN